MKIESIRQSMSTEVSVECKDVWKGCADADLEHANKVQAQVFERAYFDLAVSVRTEQLLYTPSIILLNDGYACQPDALTVDFSSALEIKSLSHKNFRFLPRGGSLPHKYKRVSYKYYLTNPYLDLLIFLFVDRESGDYFFREIRRPLEYEFPIKRAHKDASKIKGNYRIIDLGSLDRASAQLLLNQYQDC